MADAEKYLGKFDRTSAEKYDEFLSELGVNFLLRKAATVSSPVFEVHIIFFIILILIFGIIDLLTKKLQILYINFFYMRENLDQSRVLFYILIFKNYYVFYTKILTWQLKILLPPLFHMGLVVKRRSFRVKNQCRN